MRSIIVILSLILCVNNLASAQTDWPFKKFKTDAPNAIFLPYSIDQLWLFEQSGKWGMYSETREETLVPPKYDLVLPSLEKNLFYIMNENSVGIYSTINYAELIKPIHLNLQVLKDKEGNIFIRSSEKIVREGYDYTSHSIQHVTYSLTKSESDNSWLIDDPAFDIVVGSDINIRKDFVAYHKDQLWIHHHALLVLDEIAPKENGDASNYILSDVIEQSGIISANDKTYKLPPKYTSIEATRDYIIVEAAKEPSFESSAYERLFTNYGMYTLDYQLMNAPQKGYVGTISGGGFYAYDYNTITIFDAGGAERTKVRDYEEGLAKMFTFNDKYYIANYSFDPEEQEMSVFNHLIYSNDGQLINTLTFGFVYIYEDAGIAIVSVIDPDSEYDLIYGVLDLTTDQMLIEPKYDYISKWDFKETLSPCSIGSCDYYYDAVINEKHTYFDKNGDAQTGVIGISASGADYEIIQVAKDSSPDQEDPFTATHIVELITDEMWGFEEIIARVVDQHGELAVYETYSDYSEKINYGLAYLNEGEFILAPIFEKISFDKKAEMVNLIYSEENYSFPISRYEK